MTPPRGCSHSHSISEGAIVRSHTMQRWPEPGPNHVTEHFSLGSSSRSSFVRTMTRISFTSTLFPPRIGQVLSAACEGGASHHLVLLFGAWRRARCVRRPTTVP